MTETEVPFEAIGGVRARVNSAVEAGPNVRPAGPSRLAQQLALAHLIERLIESGKIKNYAEAARRFGVSRARMTQIGVLINLAPEIQETILAGEAHFSERSLRQVLHETQWARQGTP